MPAGSYVKRMPWGQQKPLLGYGIDWSHPITQGLIGCWLFNDGCGSNANGLSAICGCGVFGAGNASPKWHPKGVSFDGGDRIVPQIFNNPTSAISVISSFTPTLMNRIAVCGAQVTDNLDGYHMGWNIDKIYFKRDNGLRIVFGATTGLPLSATYHGAWTHGANGTRLYLNSKPDGSDTLSTYIAPSQNNRFAIGAPSVSTANYAGIIHYLMVFDKVLSAAEVASLYAEPYCFIEGYNYGRSYSVPSSAFINSTYWYQNPILEAI